MIIGIPLYARQILVVAIPMLVGIAFVWVSYRNPDGWMRNLRLLGAVLIVYGFVILGETLGLFGGDITIPTD